MGKCGSVYKQKYEGGGYTDPVDKYQEKSKVNAQNTSVYGTTPVTEASPPLVYAAEPTAPTEETTQVTDVSTTTVYETEPTDTTNPAEETTMTPPGYGTTQETEVTSTAIPETEQTEETTMTSPGYSTTQVTEVGTTTINHIVSLIDQINETVQTEASTPAEETITSGYGTTQEISTEQTTTAADGEYGEETSSDAKEYENDEYDNDQDDQAQTETPSVDGQGVENETIDKKQVAGWGRRSASLGVDKKPWRSMKSKRGGARNWFGGGQESPVIPLKKWRSLKNKKSEQKSKQVTRRRG